MSGLKQKRPGGQGSLIQSLMDADRAILNIIKSKEDLGISIADIKREALRAALLPNTQVTKSIKILITGQLVKEVPNIKYKGGKHYMASEFEPSKELTGGAWYVDGKLDMEFILQLRNVSKQIVTKFKVVTAAGVYDFFKKNDLLKVEVSIQQIAEILKSMALDNEILEVTSTGLGDYHSIHVGEVCYKPVRELGQAAKTGAMVSIPCGVCPRINECTPDGIISPATCVYYTQWLDF